MKMFTIKKYVKAPSSSEAIKLERTQDIDEIKFEFNIMPPDKEEIKKEKVVVGFELKDKKTKK